MRRWVKIAGVTIVSVLVLIVAALAVLYFSLESASKRAEKLGGNWYIERTQPLMGESSLGRHWRLQRAHGQARTTIAHEPFPYRYIEDDCVVYAVLVQDVNRVLAACGDRPPILVVTTKRFMYGHELQVDPIRINGRTFAWSEIKQHALHVESFPQPQDE
jgi:hypothetical protein